MAVQTLLFIFASAIEEAMDWKAVENGIHQPEGSRPALYASLE